MSTTLEQLQYGFDRDSRRVWRQRATTQGWDNTYVYDSLSQVISDDLGDLNLARNAIAGIPANGSRWQYDETGNWHGYQTQVDGAATLSQARTHDKGNRLMEVSEAAVMRTDRAGRMLETVPGPDGDWTKGYQITWDAWSRIVGVASVEGETVTPLATYGYDGLTRRVTRYTDDEDVTHHSYYNDAWRPLEERKDSESTAATSYLWGARHRDDLVRRDRAVGGTTLNETRYILMDYFSPAAITDESGDVTERYQFSAFGLRTILNPDFTVRSDSECAMEFAFQGQFEDAETGWMNYGYRYYLASLGRWACKDPIGITGGRNLYLIAENDPLNYVDYLGLTTAGYDVVDPEGSGLDARVEVTVTPYSLCTCRGEGFLIVEVSTSAQGQAPPQKALSSYRINVSGEAPVTPTTAGPSSDPYVGASPQIDLPECPLGQQKGEREVTITIGDAPVQFQSGGGGPGNLTGPFKVKISWEYECETDPPNCPCSKKPNCSIKSPFSSKIESIR